MEIMSRRRRRTVTGLAAVAGLASAALAVPPGAGAARQLTTRQLTTTTGGATFSNFEVATSPPFGAGGTCPGGSSCTNGAAEPQIRADPAGTFYATSENGLGGGTDAWSSSDGGAHYRALLSPNAVSKANTTGLAPGGGDTDVAVAPVKNAAGRYNVYVASLSLADVDVSTSTDGGSSWALNPLGASVPGDDREWIAADGASKVCVSYHDIATFNVDVNCSADAGRSFTQLGDAIDANHAFLIDNNEIGNLVIDPGTHNVYQLLSGIDNAGELLGSGLGTVGYHDVWLAVSTDGGRTFTDHRVYSNPSRGVGYGHQFVNLSADTAGNLYAVYSDDHNVAYSSSKDHGSTWSAPVRVNTGNAATAIMPWSVALAPGKLDIVFYGTSFFDGVTPPDSYPDSATWYVYFDQNLTALSGGSFNQVAATPVVHRGGVCEGGISCTGNRDLYDDFGVAVNPLTGLASIVYSDDQYSSAAAGGFCQTAQDSNSANCDHTSFATQTGGTGIN